MSRELEEGADDGPCDDNELDGPHDVDDEPSLGSLNTVTKEDSRWSRPKWDRKSFNQTAPQGNSDELEAGDGGHQDDDEPSLGSLNDMNGNGARYHAVPGLKSVDCEDDPAEGPLEVNEDGDGNPDAEPLLGWSEQMSQKAGAWGSNGTEAEQGSTSPSDLSKAHERYQRRGERSKGVTVEDRGYGGRKVIRHLTEDQKAAVAERLDPYGMVSVR